MNDINESQIIRESSGALSNGTNQAAIMNAISPKNMMSQKSLIEDAKNISGILRKVKNSRNTTTTCTINMKALSD